jgi:hypothetical protein
MLKIIFGKMGSIYNLNISTKKYQSGSYYYYLTIDNNIVVADKIIIAK